MITIKLGKHNNLFVCRNCAKLDLYDKKGYLHMRIQLSKSPELWIEKRKYWNGNWKPIKRSMT